MATAICLTCGAASAWRAQRGRRLSELRCACGGLLRQAIWHDGRWVMAPERSRRKGQRYQTCGVCQRQILHVRVAVIAFRLPFGDRRVHLRGDRRRVRNQAANG